MTSHRWIITALAAAVLALGCEAEPPDEPTTAEGRAAVTAAEPAPTAAEPAAEPAPTAPDPTAETTAEPTPGIAGVAGVAPAPDPDAPRFAAEELDLEALNTALRGEGIKNGEALERYINDRDNKITRVDIDRDGTVDLVQVEEVRHEDEVHFEIRAVPSSTRKVDDAVTIAIIRVRPEQDEGRIVVVSEYTDVVIVEQRPRRYEYVEVVDYDDDGLIVLGPRHHFFTWVFTVERPVYEGVVIYTLDRHIVRPHRVRVAFDHCWPPGHCKHHHHKHRKYHKGCKHCKHKKYKHKNHKHKHKHKKRKGKHKKHNHH